MHHRRHRRHGRRHMFHGFGGFEGPRARFFRPGELRLALLALLAEGPKHGYELMRQLEERSGGMYRASAGSTYPTLQQLEDEGLAQSERVNGKRVYQLTDAGRAEVEAEERAIGRIWRRAEEWGDWSYATAPEAWEIARPAALLAKAALQSVARSDGDRQVIEAVRDILEDARSRIDALGR